MPKVKRKGTLTRKPKGTLTRIRNLRTDVLLRRGDKRALARSVLKKNGVMPKKKSKK